MEDILYHVQYKENQLWLVGNCHSCGKGGSIIQLGSMKNSYDHWIKTGLYIARIKTGFQTMETD